MHWNLWIVWPLGIAIWLLVGLVLFAVFERYGFMGKDERDQITLSYFVYTVGKKFPLAIYLFGFFQGGVMWALAVHFFWHWCPPGSISEGMLWLNGNASVIPALFLR